MLVVSNHRIAFALLLLLPLALPAAWTLLEDFESYPDGYDASGLFPYAVWDGSDPEFWVFSEDIEDPGANKGYFVDWHDFAGDVGVTWVSIPLPQAIPEGGVGTIYLRFYQEGHSNRWHFGTTSEVGASQAEPPGANLDAWGEHSTIVRIQEGGILDAHSGGYRDSAPRFSTELDTWYEFWQVINNAADVNDKTWKLYVRGPGQTEPEEMSFEPSAPRSLLAFRNINKGSIKAVIISTNDGSPGPSNLRDLWLIDDVYVDAERVNLGDPRLGEDVIVPFGTGRWGPYTVQISDGLKWVDTGDWLGGLSVDAAMNSGTEWVYSYKLKQWLWISRANLSLDSGSWIYVHR